MLLTQIKTVILRNEVTKNLSQKTDLFKRSLTTFVMTGEHSYVIALN